MKQSNRTARRWAAISTLAAIVSLSGASSVQADQAGDIQRVRSGIATLTHGAQPDSVSPSVIPGLYEVMVGPQIYYVSGDGKYLLSGKLIDIAKREDLTTSKIAKAKAEAIEKMGEKNMVIFSPKKVKHTITVFTDIDCGYCRKLHSQIDKYNDLGIRVRYMSFPRAGIGSTSYNKAVTVWCSDDRNKAMTEAKSGKELPRKECKNPVKAEYELGKALGINGTPALFLSDGEMLPGYVPPARLAAYLDQKEGNTSSKH